MTKASGSAGARRAAALLGVAICAEAAHTTLDADSAKVDLRLDFRSAFSPNTLFSIPCQVKHGNSYKAASTNSEILKIKFDGSTIDALKSANGPGLLVWVPMAPSSRVYWYVIDPRNPPKNCTIQIPRHQFVTPSLRFYLTRFSVYKSYSAGRPTLTVASFDREKLTTNARKAYAELKQRNWANPVTGVTEVTRLGWRHVTRRSKSRSRRCEQLRIVPYLKRFLDGTPDRIIHSAPEFSFSGGSTTESRYIVCWYRRALKIDGAYHGLQLRIREDISYPTAWYKFPLDTQDIKHRSVLQSWWCKKEKK